MIAGLPDPVSLATFLGAGLVLNLTPGADVMFAMASGVRGGWRAGVAAAAGVSAGSMIHVTLTAFGAAALFAAWPPGFATLRWAGAGYLLWLAWRSWQGGGDAETTRGAQTLGRAARQGLVTNVLNPKVALFVLAFLPQFADPAQGPVWSQILVLGTLFSITGFVVTASYGGVAGLLRDRVAAAKRTLDRVAALVFTGLALRLVWT
ncbi:LysE family translocator [Litorisediminicola beolgyonensis]|uniref:LysE family translocator n=1 Tax=Litorisediminicola beolgyonensis TaxID=1173614 RepID=A0ABW3ZKS9_9RHOB